MFENENLEILETLKRILNWIQENKSFLGITALLSVLSLDFLRRVLNSYLGTKKLKENQAANRKFFALTDKFLKKIDKSWELKQQADEACVLKLNLDNQEFVTLFGGEEEVKTNKVVWEQGIQGNISPLRFQKEALLVLLSRMKLRIKQYFKELKSLPVRKKKA